MLFGPCDGGDCACQETPTGHVGADANTWVASSFFQGGPSAHLR